MIYQHPLAYLLGLEGLALMRAWAGDYDRDFVERRLSEIRRLLDAEALAGHEGVLVERRDTLTGYGQWAATYDQPNSLFEQDEPILHRIIDTLPPGDALDAACGTGRIAEYLTGKGHRTIGVDSSPEMVDRARERVPTGSFCIGDLHELPLPDSCVDLVVSALALTHVPALAPVLAEFARVLRPGGQVVISDAHYEIVFRGSVPHALGPNDEPGVVPAYLHTAGDFVRAALSAGLQIRGCEEPQPPPAQLSIPPAPPDEVNLSDWRDWPWSLLGLAPEASGVAWAVPPVMVWHFALPD